MTHSIQSAFNRLGTIFGSLLGCLFRPLLWMLPLLVLGGLVVLFLLNPTNPLSFLSGATLSVHTAPAIVTQIRARSTLVTTEFTSHVQTKVEHESVVSWLPNEQLLLQAEGTILAGIDLHHITAEDVTVNGSEVRIQVPPAYIVSQEMQNVQLFTQEGLLPGIDPTMQQMAEDDAYVELRRAACENNILQRAEQAAQVALTDLLTPMGFETIRLVQQAAPVDNPDGC